MAGIKDTELEILKAFKECKTIEFTAKEADDYWHSINIGDVLERIFNFQSNTYRVKKETKYKPYKHINEVVTDMKEYGPFVKEKGSNTYYAITQFDSNAIHLNSIGFISYAELLDKYEWLFNTPCGFKDE